MQLIVTLAQEPVVGVARKKLGQRAKHHTSSPVLVPRRGTTTILIKIELPPLCHMTEEAPSTWQLGAAGERERGREGESVCICVYSCVSVQVCVYEVCAGVCMYTHKVVHEIIAILEAVRLVSTPSLTL